MEQRWTIRRDGLGSLPELRWGDEYVCSLARQAADSLEPLLEPPSEVDVFVAIDLKTGSSAEVFTDYAESRAAFERMTVGYRRWVRRTLKLPVRVVDPEPEAAVPEFRGSGLLAVSADPLPEGVCPLPDGRLVCYGLNLPDGWQHRPHINEPFIDGSLLNSPWHIYEVRPVPVPGTEDVRWQDAIGRRLPDGREITGAWSDSRGVAYIGVATESCGSTSYTVPKPDADGMVTVLAGER